MTLDDPRAWLEAHINLERGIGVPADVQRATAPTLDRIWRLTELLGSPQLDFGAIHLTGTNGKTSTARMLTHLLGVAGLRTGLYTSPHLERINERIIINGAPIGDEELDEQLRVVALVEEHMDEPPSYFEILTAAAFRAFGDEAVDVGVIEVGMGGRWDATNVIDAAVAVITNVELDHTNFLGDTREAIAAEKAGIIKPDCTLVLGETDPDLYHFFAEREPARVLLRDRDFRVLSNRLAVGGRVVDLATPMARYEEVFVSLHGPHQALNAAIALTAAEAWAEEPLDDETVRAAFASATSPGRMEVVRRDPLVVLDGAHNVAGAEVLRAGLDEAFGSVERTLVVGLLREKDPGEMLAALGIDDAARLVVCPPPSPRALDPEVVARAAEVLGFPSGRIEVADDVREAVGSALVETPPEGQVVIAGSLYVVGAARGILARD